MKIRTLMVDDEAFARDALRGLLAHEPDIEVVGEATNGKDAVAAIEELNPKLVFLDVQMPGMTGFDVVAQLDPTKLPVIIFVTSNENFAVKAFEVHALDYITKPAKGERVKLALERVRKHIGQYEDSAIQQKLSALLKDLKIEPRHPGRLAVKSGGRIVFVALTDIDWIEAADNYAKLHAGTEAHLLRETMNALEAKLPTDRFVRINRSTIVNVDRVKELHPMFHGEYTVVLRNGTRLTLSRGYRDKLRLLGLS